MNSKILLLTVAVIAVGLFALPSTMSLFSGQHTFYDGANVTCSKCHQDIADELASSENKAHTSSSKLACEGCHKTDVDDSDGKYNGANVSNGTWGFNSSGTYGTVVFKAHAAVTVECLACHGYNPTSKFSGVSAMITSSDEAHRIFYYESVSDKEIGDISQTTIAAASGTNFIWYTQANQTAIKLKGTNTACVGCHTHAVVNITWKRSVGYGLDVDTTSGAMDITAWSVNQTTTTTYTSN